MSAESKWTTFDRSLAQCSLIVHVATWLMDRLLISLSFRFIFDLSDDCKLKIPLRALSLELEYLYVLNRSYFLERILENKNILKPSDEFEFRVSNQNDIWKPSTEYYDGIILISLKFYKNNIHIKVYVFFVWKLCFACSCFSSSYAKQNTSKNTRQVKWFRISLYFIYLYVS